MAYVAPGYPRHMASEDDHYYAQYTGHRGGPPSEGEQPSMADDQELAWYYHQQQQHQLYLQQQWAEQQHLIHLQAQSGYQTDDFYDEETAIKSEAIEAAYDQFYDDFMRAGPSVRSPPRTGASALAPITIQDDHEAPGYTEPYQAYPRAYQDIPDDYRNEQHPEAFPSRPPPRTHHSLPIAASSSSAVTSSASSSSLDPRMVRSERSTPLTSDSGLSAKLGVKLKRGREPRIGREEGRVIVAREEEHEAKPNDASSSRYGDSVQSDIGWADQAAAFDHENFDDESTSPSTGSLATLNPTPTRRKPGRPRGWRELASINPTPLPLTPKKLRNGRVRNRSRESSASASSSSEEDGEQDRLNEVRHEVYRPQYRLARPYRRRVAGADADKGKKSRTIKERSLKISLSADSAEENIALPAQIPATPAWTKPWILKNETHEEDDAVPSYPEVHYFIRWMHDLYHARKSARGQTELMEQWGLSSLPPNSQEEATKQRSPARARDGNRAIDTPSSKKRDAEDDEDDAAVACLLFSDEAERPTPRRLEACPLSPMASPGPAQAQKSRTPSPSGATAASPPSPPHAISTTPAPAPLWLATIATRISILDTAEKPSLYARARGTPQDYPRLLREQFSTRVLRGVESQGGREGGEAPPAAAGAAVSAGAGAVPNPSPLEDLQRVSIALPLPAAGRPNGRRSWPSSLETKPLWEHFVARYRLKRSQGCSHEEALWCGPALSLPVLSLEREERHEEARQRGEGEEEEVQEEEMKSTKAKRGAPLILRRNLPRAVRKRV
ncbi:hypothetical protein BCV69DRAFT_285127 [Microstroma glucosiphilum]|uniref:Uncharacterized protein n=1 Tax=Pseudomicrostroma glucosiphilum TaxID=1684307 RepID=A0A316TZI1_9BASI|nr:hypothetical protein BCV69DRAFT_285127 [Pseudomicrostroma glucosiphilum]PWN18497.1 hypothetical protein BCV69DRAFT_285127 [Pseudomicrostroma glucosiphilum]